MSAYQPYQPYYPLMAKYQPYHPPMSEYQPYHPLMSEDYPYKQGECQKSSRSTDDPSSGKAPHESKATKRKRRRVIRACDECRRSKFRCDELLPCSRCVERGLLCSSLRGNRRVHAAPTDQLHCKLTNLPAPTEQFYGKLTEWPSRDWVALGAQLPPLHPLLSLQEDEDDTDDVQKLRSISEQSEKETNTRSDGRIPQSHIQLLKPFRSRDRNLAKFEVRMHTPDDALAIAQTTDILPPPPLLSLQEDEDDTDDIQKLRSISEQPEKETNTRSDGRRPQSHVQPLESDHSVSFPKENSSNNQLFSNSKNFSIGNGATFTAAGGDIHQNTTNDHSSNTTIYNNCTFARETGSPTKSSPPPSHRSKRSPDHQKRRRWSITTFVHTVYHHYLQPVVYPIAWAVPAWTMPLSWVNFVGPNLRCLEVTRNLAIELNYAYQVKV
ncbi:hypothetical protein BDP27DRAFT_1397664 [Rhodocollybia butyracea]|uniref:Zn(2)-C6 fungal-type domain-containing protein n=1 Tax=Rhodocollybia butyracea TaxID=206335 RepID=A0A9P5Q9A6_9AGAR|nr:hypothetical protein BDP27DRAFT_1397664 [Rhodocollybia butyracea]